MNNHLSHNHPYMTRSKAKNTYTSSDCDKKRTKQSHVINPYISYSDGIKLYMNRGISDDLHQYAIADYEHDGYIQQTDTVTHTPKNDSKNEAKNEPKNKSKNEAKNEPKNESKNESKNEPTNKFKTIEDEYILL